MANLRQRSYEKELLDRDDLPFEDIRRNMQELNVINTLLGGHAITTKGVQQLLGGNVNSNKPVHIAEIGCGGGDNLVAISKWLHKGNTTVQLTGIDINPQCIAFAKGQERNAGIEFICSDYRDARFEQKPDIIFSSLFCHHFTNDNLVAMLLWMKENSTLGFFINDLHRHPLAYHSIKLLTRLFSRSYLVKNDAPLSVKRGFVKNEWEDLATAAQLNGLNIQWCWAFRWLVTYTHDVVV